MGKFGKVGYFRGSVIIVGSSPTGGTIMLKSVDLCRFESCQGHEELISLSGQVVNGMMSADGDVWSKLIDRAVHAQVAKVAVAIANDMLKEIDDIVFR